MTNEGPLLCPRCRGVRRSLREGDTLPLCAVDGAALVTERALAKSDGDPFLGALLEGGFAPLEHMAQGAQSAVYRGTGPSGVDVAVKVMRLDGPSAELLQSDWERETTALGRLSSDWVTRMVGAGHVSTPKARFVAFTWIEGETLRDRVGRSSLQVGEALEVAMGLCQGLHSLHGAGFVHGDLKPDNVMLGSAASGERWVKLIDLGSAVKPGQITPAATPLYGAPEQIRGGSVDFRTDLYGLGCTLHRLLAGQPPFLGPADAVRREHLETTAPPLEHVDQRLARLVERLLAKDPTARPASANDVLDELTAIAGASRETDRIASRTDAA